MWVTEWVTLAVGTGVSVGRTSEGIVEDSVSGSVGGLLRITV